MSLSHLTLHHFFRKEEIARDAKAIAILSTNNECSVRDVGARALPFPRLVVHLIREYSSRFSLEKNTKGKNMMERGSVTYDSRNMRVFE